MLQDSTAEEKKMFLMLVEVPPRLWVFPKEKLSLQQLLWKKSWHMLRFLYCILFHSIIQSLQFPTYLFAIYILQPAQWKYSPFLSCLSLKGCQQPLLRRTHVKINLCIHLSMLWLSPGTTLTEKIFHLYRITTVRPEICAHLSAHT